MSIRALAAKRVVTCDASLPGVLGVIDDAVVALDGACVVYVGPRSLAPPTVPLQELGDRVVTPGLVDAHTHACWLGSRHGEYTRRMAGGDYRAIANEGGGILATQGVVASASEQELAEALRARVRRMASLGVTTVEVKTGYGLELAHERKQLAAIARVAAGDDVPALLPTLLALHALPQAARGSPSMRAAYIAQMAGELIPEVARARLAHFVDAYVDREAFSVDEARLVGEAALKAGLGVRMHIGQFADVGGAQLAASLGARSADHLEHISPQGIEALAAAGVSAVLLPVASLTLGQLPPPIPAMRSAGIAFVVGSDANPGTAPTESLPLAMALAVRSYGLSPEEAILAATRNAAESLGLRDRGVLRTGSRADLVVWDLPHEQAIVQPWGVAKTHLVIRGGREL
jgi:imidazolonepropionase